MLGRVRDAYESASRSLARSHAADGSFTYDGVNGHFTIYSVNDFSDNRVKAQISYNADDVPWLQRSRFESDVLDYLKKKLSQYRIVEYSFVRNY